MSDEQWETSSRLAIGRCPSPTNAPTLVMTSTNSGYYGSAEGFGNWQKNIPDSELVLIPGDSFHISASYPDACASKAAEFLARLGHLRS